MTLRTVDLNDLISQLPELIDLVEDGQEIILTDHHRPVARLAPVGNTTGERVPGLHTGVAWVSDDFDEPLSDEFWSETVTSGTLP